LKKAITKKGETMNLKELAMTSHYKTVAIKNELKQGHFEDSTTGIERS
jgi:hypothetical protein